ncbi:MAG: glycerol-3-phosphate acyltransferase [bacterium]
MIPILIVVLIGALAYLLGSVSAAYFAGRSRGMDLRFEGEETLDFLNAGLVLGRPAGAMVFVADFLKGQIAVGLAMLLSGSPWAVALAGLLAVAGQVWPLFHGFAGGRGTAVAAGVLLAASPWTLVISATLLALLYFVTGRLAHAEVLTFALLPGVTILTEKTDLALMSLTIFMAAVLIIPRRRVVEVLLGMRKTPEEEEEDRKELEEELEKESGGPEDPPAL